MIKLKCSGQLAWALSTHAVWGGIFDRRGVSPSFTPYAEVSVTLVESAGFESQVSHFVL